MTRRQQIRRPWHRPSLARRFWLRGVDAVITVGFAFGGLVVGSLLGSFYATVTL